MQIDITKHDNTITVTLDAEAYFTSPDDIDDNEGDTFTGVITPESTADDTADCIFECELTSGPMLTVHGFYSDTMHIAHLPQATVAAITDALA